MKINDITYEIRGALFEVNKVLGPGFLERFMRMHYSLNCTIVV